jgi:hypothetical protein
VLPDEVLKRKCLPGKAEVSARPWVPNEGVVAFPVTLIPAQSRANELIFTPWQGKGANTTVDGDIDESHTCASRFYLPHNPARSSKQRCKELLSLTQNDDNDGDIRYYHIL